MKRTIGFWAALGLSVLVLGACGATSGQVTAETDVTPTPPPGIPVRNESSSSPAPTPTEPTSTPAQSTAEQPPKRRQNPRRLYQLDELETVKLKIDKHEFSAWVMDTDSKRAEGMMWLENQDFKDTEAMIFVFQNERELGFWMRNTLVDLDIAYLDANRRIINTTTMKALDESNVPSLRPAKYAIEFRARLLRKLGVKAGMKAEFPATVVAKE